MIKQVTETNEDQLQMEASRTVLARTIRGLRLRLGDTQQQFATRLGLAIATIVRYETSRPPRGETLRKLYALAGENGFSDIQQQFHAALLSEVRDSVIHVQPHPFQINVLKLRFIQALGDDVHSRDTNAPDCVGEWAAVRCVQKIRQDSKYADLMPQLNKLIAAMRDELRAEAEQVCKQSLSSDRGILADYIPEFVEWLDQNFLAPQECDC